MIEEIRTATWNLLQNRFSKCKEIYTVVCSISLVEGSSFQIVSLGFGTKSLPHTLATQHQGNLIKDMHAEILAIKGFRRFLFNKLQMHIQRSQGEKPGEKPGGENGEHERREESKNKNQSQLKEAALQNGNIGPQGHKSTKQQSPLFVFDNKRKKYTACKEIILYSSEVFCGDCSINQANLQFSGSKPLSMFGCEHYEKGKYMTSILRTKPGRMDLPASKRSLSLCCSDKLAVYNILGIQGKRLFNLMTPVYLSRVVLDRGDDQSVKRGMDIVARLSAILGKSKELVSRKLLNIVIDGKERPISRQFRVNNPLVTILNRKEQNEVKEGGFLCGVLADGVQQYLNGRTGLPEGSSLSNYTTKGKASVFTSKCIPIPQDDDCFQYGAIKDRIKKLFGEWTDQFK